MLQSQVIAQIFDLIYPIGSLYFSTTLDTKEKVEKLFGGTWEKLPDGYAIWTASSGAGNIIAPGLPNITGTLSSVWSATTFDHQPTWGGAISMGSNVTDGSAGGNGWRMYLKPLSFDANNGASVKGIYGNSNTVQPAAYKTYVFKRLTLGGGLNLLIASIMLALKRRSIC